MKKILTLFSLVLILSSCTRVQAPAPTESPEALPTEAPEPTPATLQLAAENESAKTDMLNELKSCEYDIDKDGEDDVVTLYVDAKEDERGNLMNDDGHEWLLEASLSSGEYYTLYSGRIQQGGLYFELSEFYNEEPEPTVVTYLTSGAGFEIKKFTFDKVFKEELIYSSDNATEGGINKIYSTLPSYR